MANEARIMSSLHISKGNMEYQSRPTSFTATVTGTKGPTPGAFSATTAGVSVDLSELTNPGLCRIANLDSTNFIEYGIWDGLEFIPFGRVLAGETYVLRLSPNLGKSFGTGTGTTDSGNAFRVKADTAACNVVVEAFEV